MIMNHSKTQRMTGLALFTGIIVVLQVIGTFVKFGPFSITLTLIPIVVGAAIYGPKSGAYLGGVFGFVVLVACIFGWDMGGAVLWNAQPLLTAVVCLGKGVLAGLAAGDVYRALSRRSTTAAAISAAVVSPVVNTGLFLLALYFLFYDVLVSWATGAGADIATYILTGLVGVNFVLELGVNMVLSPVVVRIIHARKAMPNRRA
ncbi:ECF transporter S component [Lawsonibacter faecis]|nr:MULTISPECIES: ECF transporter S component [Oscillospiraceae]